MTRLSLLLGVLTVCFTVTTAAAQSGPLRIYLDAGPSVPTSPTSFSNNWETGFGYGIGAGYEVSSGIEVIGSISTEDFGFDTTGPATDDLREELGDLVVEGGGTTSLQWAGGVKLNLITVQALHLYATSQAGYTRIRIKEKFIAVEGEQQVEPSSAASGLGVIFSAGLGVGVLPTIQLYIEPRYTFVSVEPDSIHFLPLRLGFVYRP